MTVLTASVIFTCHHGKLLDWFFDSRHLRRFTFGLEKRAPTGTGTEEYESGRSVDENR
jgi:hypothetical protein